MSCGLVLRFVHDSDTHCCYFSVRAFCSVSLRLSSLLVPPMSCPNAQSPISPSWGINRDCVNLPDLCLGPSFSPRQSIAYLIHRHSSPSPTLPRPSAHLHYRSLRAVSSCLADWAHSVQQQEGRVQVVPNQVAEYQAEARQSQRQEAHVQAVEGGRSRAVLSARAGRVGGEDRIGRSSWRASCSSPSRS